VLPPALSTNFEPIGDNRITPENFRRIRKGMMLAEVEAILGPPGEYTTLPDDYSGAEFLMHGSEFVRSDLNMAVWRGSTLRIDLGFTVFDKNPSVSTGMAHSRTRSNR